MLFLGTERYPDEGEFARFISSNGGRNNAFTDSEETVYYFDVRAAALPDALSRFADFFVAPLFTEAATAREVAAIDAEHAKNLQLDDRRFDRLLRMRADPSHPFSRFFTGTRATLEGGSSDARAALLAFYRRYYRAEQMSLVVIGPQPLDELEGAVAAAFGPIPSGDGVTNVAASAEYDELPLPLDPALRRLPGGGQVPQATLMVPVLEQRSVSLTWCVPTGGPAPEAVVAWLDAKPLAIVTLLLSARGSGSLVAKLKEAGLGASVSVGVQEETMSFAVLTTTIGLTRLGLERWREVVSIVYSYLRMLREDGVPPHVFADAATSRELNFRFAEPAPSLSWLTSTVGALRTYPPSRWLTGPALVSPDVAAQSVVRGLLTRLTPPSALVTLTARELAPQAPSKEPIYGTRYGTLSIEEELKDWVNAPRIPGLAAPPPNRFLPYKLDIKEGAARAASPRGAQPPQPPQPPTLLLSAPAVRLHWLADRTFRRPKGYVYVLLRSPAFYSSASAAVQAELFSSLLSDYLQDVTFEAAQAGLGFGVGVSYEGLLLQFGGFDQRLPELVELVARSARTFAIRPAAYKRKLDALTRSLRNLEQRQPVALCSYHRNLALQTPRYSNAQLLTALEAEGSEGGPVSLEGVRGFQQRLCSEAELESFVGGNVARAEALEMLRKLRAALPAVPLDVSSRPLRRVRRVPTHGATRQFASGNPDDSNSAVEVYYQIGLDEGDDWLYLALLSQVLSKPFYSELRTRQQLGYIVQCSVGEAEGVRGLALSVQSTVLPPQEVEKRIEAFLVGYRAGPLERMTLADFTVYRDALVAQILDVDGRLDAQSSRLWSECARRRYDFGRPWHSADRLLRGACTLEGLRNFFDMRVARGGERCRRLSTHVFSRAAAPNAFRMDPVDEDGLFPAEADRLALSLRISP